MGTVPDSLRVALLLSTSHFEDFYGHSLGLSRHDYVEAYRNDWSWDWCRMLALEGVEANIYVATTSAGEQVTTEDWLPRAVPRSERSRQAVAPLIPLLRRTPVGRWVDRQAANAGAMLRSLRSALIADGVDVLCVQEYWTARLDLLVRAVELPVVAIDQGLPDRHEVKLLKRGSFTRTAGVVVQTEREAAKIARYGGDARRIPNAVDTGIFCPGARRLHPSRPRGPVRRKASRGSEEGVGRDPRARATPRDVAPADRRRVARLGDARAPRLRAGDRRARGLSRLRLRRREAPRALSSRERARAAVRVRGSPDGAARGDELRDAGRRERHPRDRRGHRARTHRTARPGRRSESLGRGAVGGRSAPRHQLGSAARASILANYDQAVVGPRLAQMLLEARGTAVPSG